MNRSDLGRLIAGSILSAVALFAAADEPAKIPPGSETGVVKKVEQAVVRGVTAAASGVQRGAEAAARGVQTGAHAAARGIARAASATADVVDKTARKIGPASESAASSASAPTGGK